MKQLHEIAEDFGITLEQGYLPRSRFSTDSPMEGIMAILATKCSCGKEVIIQGAGVIHELPLCEAFIERDPVSFLAYLNGYWEGFEKGKQQCKSN